MTIGTICQIVLLKIQSQKIDQEFLELKSENLKIKGSKEFFKGSWNFINHALGTAVLYNRRTFRLAGDLRGPSKFDFLPEPSLSVLCSNPPWQEPHCRPRGPVSHSHSREFKESSRHLEQRTPPPHPQSDDLGGGSVCPTHPLEPRPPRPLQKGCSPEAQSRKPTALSF